MKSIETQTPTNINQTLEIHSVNPVWEKNGNKVRVLFVAVNVTGYYSLPVRILSLMMRNDPLFDDGFDFRFIEFEDREPLDHLFNIIDGLSVDIIGFSVNIWNRDICFKLAKKLKRVNPFLKCIAGGQEVTNSIVDYLGSYPEIDYIVDGEGEIPFSQFLKNWDADRHDILDPETVSGLHYRKNGVSVFSGPSQLVDNLDDIPSPILSGLINPDVKYKLGTMLEGTRGCPFKCSFCFEGGEKRKVRTISLPRLKQEIEFMASRDVKFFHIMDPILCNSNPARLNELADFFDEMNRQYKNIVVSVEAYAHHITPDIAKYLKSFRLIDIGLQTVNPETAKAIHRPWQPEKFKAGLDYLRQIKARFAIYLIRGLPFETFETYIKGMWIVLNENPSQLFFNELLLLNGTELRRRATEYGYTYNESPPYHAQANPWMDEQQFKLSHLIGKDVEKRYNLSARAIHTNAPWIPETSEQFEDVVLIVPKTGCSQDCLGCGRGRNAASSFFNDAVLSKLNTLANRDIEVVLGDCFEKNDLLKLMGQLVLAGSARIKLTAPAHVFGDRQWVDLLVKRGVLHFKTFLSVNSDADLSEKTSIVENFMNQLEHFSIPVELRGYATVTPHFEIVVLHHDKMNPDEYARIAFLAARPFVSVVTVPADTVERKDPGWEKCVYSMIDVAMEKDTWIKLPRKIWHRYFSDQQVDSSVISTLAKLKMVSDESNQPPCFESTKKNLTEKELFCQTF
ncbi:B12-binding domain-containing radical SAM protein [uncultured Desulfobacter sp.]|uniref:B12-binding domain-containing radical SAM protein n=1 Tax=uncultured Desulfobacter sp. TaxID=240139 RepID=UPI002AAB60CC|nr:radical SAM protein [uncultured Desulfobacter sp.]